MCVDVVLSYGLLHSKDLDVNPKNPSLDFSELKYFPIPSSKQQSDLTVSFVDTWNASRYFGKDRVHEGCDLITFYDLPGVYPVISASDGTIEKMGWLTLGGYRIGIRTDSGIYCYYAHLDSYAPQIKVGDRVDAGEWIGFVGNSGYGEEGTRGMFVTHLHFGIYIPQKEGDTPINPYPYLRELESKKLTYSYGLP